MTHLCGALSVSATDEVKSTLQDGVGEEMLSSLLHVSLYLFTVSRPQTTPTCAVSLLADENSDHLPMMQAGTPRQAVYRHTPATTYGNWKFSAQHWSWVEDQT